MNQRERDVPVEKGPEKSGNNKSDSGECHRRVHIASLNHIIAWTEFFYLDPVKKLNLLTLISANFSEEKSQKSNQ